MGVLRFTIWALIGLAAFFLVAGLTVALGIFVLLAGLPLIAIGLIIVSILWLARKSSRRRQGKIMIERVPINFK